MNKTLGMACILSSEAADILQFPSCLGGRQTLELVLWDGFSHSDAMPCWLCQVSWACLFVCSIHRDWDCWTSKKNEQSLVIKVSWNAANPGFYFMRYCHFLKCLTLAFIYLTISPQLCFLRKDKMELCGFANYRKALGKQKNQEGRISTFPFKEIYALFPKVLRQWWLSG